MRQLIDLARTIFVPLSVPIIHVFRRRIQVLFASIRSISNVRFGFERPITFCLVKHRTPFQPQPEKAAVDRRRKAASRKAKCFHTVCKTSAKISEILAACKRGLVKTRKLRQGFLSKITKEMNRAHSNYCSCRHCFFSGVCFRSLFSELHNPSIAKAGRV